MKPWERWFLLWAILSILGVICCGVMGFLIPFVVSICSFNVCITFYLGVVVLNLDEQDDQMETQHTRYDDLGYANQLSNDLNNSRGSIETNYNGNPTSEKQNNHEIN